MRLLTNPLYNSNKSLTGRLWIDLRLHRLGLSRDNHDDFDWPWGWGQGDF